MRGLADVIERSELIAVGLVALIAADPVDVHRSPDPQAAQSKARTQRGEATEHSAVDGGPLLLGRHHEHGVDCSERLNVDLRGRVRVAWRFDGHGVDAYRQLVDGTRGGYRTERFIVDVELSRDAPGRDLDAALWRASAHLFEQRDCRVLKA